MDPKQNKKLVDKVLSNLMIPDQAQQEKTRTCQEFLEKVYSIIEKSPFVKQYLTNSESRNFILQYTSIDIIEPYQELSWNEEKFMIVIINGRVEKTKFLDKSEEQSVLGEGELLFQQEIIYGRENRFQFRSLETTCIFYVKREIFEEIGIRDLIYEEDLQDYREQTHHIIYDNFDQRLLFQNIFVQYGERQEYEAQSYIVKSPGYNKKIYYVIHGSVKVIRQLSKSEIAIMDDNGLLKPDDQKQSLKLFEVSVGQFFGEENFIENRNLHYIYQVSGKQACRVVEIEFQDWMTLAFQSEIILNKIKSSYRDQLQKIQEVSNRFTQCYLGESQDQNFSSIPSLSTEILSPLISMDTVDQPPSQQLQQTSSLSKLSHVAQGPIVNLLQLYKQANSNKTQAGQFVRSYDSVIKSARSEKFESEIIGSFESTFSQIPFLPKEKRSVTNLIPPDVTYFKKNQSLEKISSKNSHLNIKINHQQRAQQQLNPNYFPVVDGEKEFILNNNITQKIQEVHQIQKELQNIERDTVDLQDNRDTPIKFERKYSSNNAYLKNQDQFIEDSDIGEKYRLQKSIKVLKQLEDIPAGFQNTAERISKSCTNKQKVTFTFDNFLSSSFEKQRENLKGVLRPSKVKSSKNLQKVPHQNVDEYAVLTPSFTRKFTQN